jgi:hypothetical protein
MQGWLWGVLHIRSGGNDCGLCGGHHQDARFLACIAGKIGTITVTAAEEEETKMIWEEYSGIYQPHSVVSLHVLHTAVCLLPWNSPHRSEMSFLTSTHVHTYIYKHAHTHTRAHTLTHTHTQSRGFPWF